MIAGFLKNHEKQEGRPARLTLGESLPEPSTLLPMPETLLEGGEGGMHTPPAAQHTLNPQQETRRGRVCRVAWLQGG